MRLLRAGLFSEAHRNHLEQSGRDTFAVFRMRLCSTKEDHAIRGSRDLVQMGDSTVFRRSDCVRSHRRLYRRAELFLVYTQSMEYFDLSCFDRAAVAAHSGHDERLAAFLLNGVDDAGKQVGETTHSSAAGGDGDLVAFLDPINESGLDQFLTNVAARVGNMLVREALSHLDQRRRGQAWERHALMSSH